MRVVQLPRRVTYLLLGTLPAVYLVWTLDMPRQSLDAFRSVPVWGELMPLVMLFGTIGTIGLCCAPVISIPMTQLWGSRVMCFAMICGLVAMFPFTAIFVPSIVEDAFDPRTAPEFESIAGTLKFVAKSLWVLWAFTGPVAVAAHFLFKAFKDGASNNRIERTREP